MTTVKTWKAERTERTEKWIAEIVFPTIERLANKGKEKVVFTNVNDNINLDLAVEILRERYTNAKAENNDLRVWWNDYISVEDVLATLG